LGLNPLPHGTGPNQKTVLCWRGFSGEDACLTTRYPLSTSQPPVMDDVAYPERLYVSPVVFSQLFQPQPSFRKELPMNSIPEDIGPNSQEDSKEPAFLETPIKPDQQDIEYDPNACSCTDAEAAHKYRLAQARKMMRVWREWKEAQTRKTMRVWRE
jgi:hypothetical protein